MPRTAPASSGRRRVARVTAVVASAAIALTLAACSTGGATTADGKTVLTVYGWKGGDTEPANIKQINAAFEKANPDIDVKFEFVPPNDTYTQRVQPELLAGDSADVIMTDSGKVQTWGKAGYLEDLSDSSWVSNVLPQVAPFVRQSGKVYALPMEVIGIDLYANTDLLAKAGITEMPTTWDEFTADLAQVKAAGITPLALPNKAGWTGSSIVAAMAASTVYQKNPDWDAQFLAGKASFTDWKPTVEKFVSLNTDGYVDFASELGVDEWAQGLPDFTSGKSAFWFQGAWNLSAVESAGVKSVFLPFPAGDAGEGPAANLFVGTMWSITAQSHAKDAAAKYLKFWSDAQNAAPFLQAENAVAPFQNATSPTTDATASFVSAFDAGKYQILPSDTWFSTAGEKTFQVQTQALMLGQLSVDDYLASLDKQLRPSN